MNAERIKLLIDSLGKTHAELLAASIVPEGELIELFPGIDELYLEPEVGVEMSFGAESGRYEKVNITLREPASPGEEYKGELPHPYSLCLTQSDAHKFLGKPLEYSGAMKLPEPLGQTGGWESYQLDPKLYPNQRLILHYLESMEVDAIVFDLVDKVHV